MPCRNKSGGVEECAEWLRGRAAAINWEGQRPQQRHGVVQHDNVFKRHASAPALGAHDGAHTAPHIAPAACRVTIGHNAQAQRRVRLLVGRSAERTAHGGAQQSAAAGICRVVVRHEHLHLVRGPEARDGSHAAHKDGEAGLASRADRNVRHDDDGRARARRACAAASATAIATAPRRKAHAAAALRKQERRAREQKEQQNHAPRRPRRSRPSFHVSCRSLRNS